MRSSTLGRALVLAAVAIATAFFWLSLGVQNGIEREIRALVDQVGANLFYVLRGEGSLLGEVERVRLSQLPEVAEVAGEGSESTFYYPTQTYTLTWLEVSPNYLEVMRLPLASGRPFAPGEKGVAILGWEVKEALFGEDDPLGQRVEVGAVCEVIGVLAPIPADDPVRKKLNRLVLVPAGTSPLFPGRLHPSGPSYWALLVRAKGDMARAKAAVLEALPEVEIRPISKAYAIYFFAERILSQTMMASSLGMFLLVGTTLAGLLSLTALQRGWEIGVRRAVGANRADILRMLLAEGVRVTRVGGLIGALLGQAAFPVFAQLGRSPRLGAVHGAILPFVVAVGALASLCPAWRAARMSPAQALSLRTLEAQRVYGIRVGHLTTALTLAIGVGSLFLLLNTTSTAGKYLRTIWGQIDERILLVSAPARSFLPPPELSPTDLPELAGLPGVEAAVLAGFRALPVQGPAGQVVENVYGVGRGYELLSLLTIERGRDLLADEIDKGEKVALLSRSIAQELFGEEDPVGKTVLIGTIQFRVVGVFYETRTILSAAARLIVPYSTLKELWLQHKFWVRVSPKAKVAEVKEAIEALFRERYPGKASVEVVSPAGEQAKAAGFINRVAAQLGLLGGAGMLMGATALFNLTSLLILLRTRELGIRRAVGATAWHILTLGIGEALKVCLLAGAAGLGLGMAGMQAFTRWLHFPPFGLSPIPAWATLAAACGLGALAGGWPAWRASRLSPAEALRRGRG